MALVDEVKGYKFSDIRLDIDSGQLSKLGKEIPLTNKSFQILLFLISNRDRVVSKEEILSGCWDVGYVEETTLIQHIYRIRRALGDNARDHKYIKTILKKGYRFIAEVKVVTHGFSDENDDVTIKESASSGPFDIDQTRETAIPVAPISDDANASKKITRRRSYSRALFGVAPMIVVVLSILGVYSYFLFVKREPTRLKSIAVLPFTQIGEGVDEKLGLGVADSIISRLSNQNEIRILPTSAIIRFSDKVSPDDPREIGKELRVDAVLIGTIQKKNGKVRTNIQLINTKHPTPFWTQQYDEKFSDIFSLQDEISKRVAEKLYAEI